MSDIGLILNALLGVLLVGALFIGWRLEGRLKALRASHQSFTEAVHDLDRAAARAEQGLSDLRAATDEAAESLAGRIERAGLLAQRLERLTADAIAAEKRHAETPQPAAARTATRDAAAQRFTERYAGTRTAAPAAPPAASPIAQAVARNDLILDDEGDAPTPRPALPRRLAPAAPVANDRLERLRALAQPRPAAAPRPRPRPIEDDLFDAPEPRRVAMGGAR